MTFVAPSSRWNTPPPTYDTHMSTYTTTLTPYLRLPHLLSLTWLAYPILSLIFVTFRLQLSLSASQASITSAKQNLLASCLAAEKAATAAASMPRFMAIATNKQFADAINGSMNAARAALVLALTVVEGVINFLIDIYRSTFLCFLELVIRGGLAVLIGAVNELNELIGSATSGLRTAIQNEIGSANSVIQGAIDTINRINPFNDITAPQITVPSLDALENVQLPASFQESLTKLNETLPTFSDLKEKIEAIISKPFDLVKQDINETFSGLRFDAETLPVPAENQLSFCGDLDMSVIDDLGQDLIRIAKIGTIILVVLILFLIAANCLLEWYKWRCLQGHLENTREAWLNDPTTFHPSAQDAIGAPQITLSDHNLMVLEATMAHPLVTKVLNALSTLFKLKPSQHIHLQWFFNYIFHAPALACFLIGFFGLLSVQIQLWTLDPLAAHYSQRAASAVADFSNTIAASINGNMSAQSAAYAAAINTRVNTTQTTINEGLFGWVNGTTTTLNATINEFYDDVQGAVELAFGGTLLEQPAQEFVRCLIGSKVDAIENALAFMQENLKVDMPTVDAGVLVLSPETVNEATRPIAVAAIGGGGDGEEGDDGGLIGKIIRNYKGTLEKERIMFAVFMALWGVVVLMGLAVLLWHSYGRTLIDAKDRRKFEKEQRSGGGITPFRSGLPAATTTAPVQSPRPRRAERGGGGGGFMGGFAAAVGLGASRDSSSDSERELVAEKGPNSSINANVAAKKNKKRNSASSMKPISGPVRLMAVGKKEGSTAPWYGKMTGLFKSNVEHDLEAADNANANPALPPPPRLGHYKTTSQSSSLRHKPNLSISIERAAAAKERSLPQIVLNSSGVDSPLERERPEGLRERTPPAAAVSKKPMIVTGPPRPPMTMVTTTTTTTTKTKGRLPIGGGPIESRASIAPATARSTESGVPSMITPRAAQANGYGYNNNNPSTAPVLQQQQRQQQQQQFAPPLHYGFGVDDFARIASPPTLAKTLPLPPPSRRAPPPLMKQSAKQAKQPRLVVNTNAGAISNNNNNNVTYTTSPESDSRSVTPVTRFLTQNHARKSSDTLNPNPFVTPFDGGDEQRPRQHSGVAGVGSGYYGVNNRSTVGTIGTVFAGRKSVTFAPMPPPYNDATNLSRNSDGGRNPFSGVAI